MRVAPELRPPKSVQRIASFLERVTQRSNGPLPDKPLASEVHEFVRWIGKTSTRLGKPVPEEDAEANSKVPQAPEKAFAHKPERDQIAPSRQDPEDVEEVPQQQKLEEDTRVRDLLEISEVVRLDQGLIRRRIHQRGRELPPFLAPAQLRPTVLNVQPNYFFLNSASPAPASPEEPIIQVIQGEAPDARGPTQSPGSSGVAARAYVGRPGIIPLTPDGNGALTTGVLRQDLQPPVGYTWNMPQSQDVFGMFDGRRPRQAAEGAEPPPMADALFGQITLVAPPFQIEGQPGSALQFDWKQVSRNVGPLDENALETLRYALPPGAKAIYPALPRTKLGSGAVNLRLTPSVIQTLVQRGYGDKKHVDAFQSSRLAKYWTGGMQPIRPMPGSVVPAPSGRRGDTGPQRRYRQLDFRGTQIELSGTLAGPTDPRHEVFAKLTAVDLPRAPMLNAADFARFQGSLLRGFSGVEAVGQTSAWRSSAPLLRQAGMAMPTPLALRQPFKMPMTAARPVPRLSAASIPSAAPMRMSGPAAAGLPAPRPTPGPPPSQSYRPPPTAVDVSQVPRFIAPAQQQARPFRGSIGSLGSGSSPAAPSGLAAKPSTPRYETGTSTTNITIAQPSIPSRPAAATAPKSSPAAKRGPLATPSRPPGGNATQPQPGAAPPRPSLDAPRFGGSAGPAPKQPTPPSTVKAPQSPRAEQAGQGTTSTRTSSPTMALPAKPKPVSTEEEPLALQTSTAAPGGGAGPTAGSPQPASSGAGKQDAGMAGSEINLLANEVWALLKRKLAFEAERAGKR